MQYISTRGAAPTLGFADTLLTGLARDGGLYAPSSLPELRPEAIRGLSGLAYADAAVRVMTPFIGGDFGAAELEAMTEEAYSGFRHAATAPLVQIGPNLFALELFHGPTLAFKDFAMQWLGRAMNRALAQRGARATILGATSGDTGAAAIEAFGGQLQTDVYILYPRGRVSDVQRRQMTTVGKSNVHALAIDGTFDDCQRIVKELFGDLKFRDEMCLSGVNSINWARILAQIVYYFVGAVALGAPSGLSRFPFRPEISATCWLAITPSAWVCRSSGSWSRPTRTTSSPARWRAAAMNPEASRRPSRPRWTFRFHRISSVSCSRPPASARNPSAR